MGRPSKWLFKPGARVELTCDGKAEQGITGTVADFRTYQGPRMYADVEYRLVDCWWPMFDTPYPNVWVRETWLRLAEKGTE